MSRTNYIFVDFENIQAIDLDRIAGKPIEVFLVLGQKQKSLPLDLVERIHKYHAQVHLIKSGIVSQNALDLVLAYHIGQKANAHPEGYFHILAKDKDYDPLIQHLRANHILAKRHETFSEIPALGSGSGGEAAQIPLAQRVELMTDRFKKNKTSRPKQRKTLESHIQAQFGKALSEHELEDTIKGLIAKKAIEITASGGIVYRI